MSNQQDQIIAAATGKLDDHILAAAFAKPRGATTASVGGGAIVSAIGNKKAGDQRKGAEAAGIVLGNPGAVAITHTHLLTMQLKVGFTGQIKEVTEVLSTVPFADVDSLEVKRMGLAGVMEISSRGATFKLEGKAADMKDFADAFAQAKGSAAG
ncbi:MAG: hypothetical protein QOH89_1128 [Pseudonocardiales bacterium]|jgi:hypothetical protein|nr:hypothetical protein [Pseudonocardiales bacterium]